MKGVLTTMWLVLKKDLLIELRTREVLATMGLFALLVVVIFAFAFNLDQDTTQEVAPGVLWVTLLFSGNLGIARVFDGERDNDCMRALLSAPAGPVAIYWAKTFGVFIFLVLMQVLIVPLTLLFVGVEVPSEGVGLLIAALLLGSLGYALIGTLFGAMLANARLREVLVPLVVYPVVVPVLIAGVKLTWVALGVGPPEAASDWLGVMAGFCMIFAAVPPWVFARVMVD